MFFSMQLSDIEPSQILSTATIHPNTKQNKHPANGEDFLQPFLHLETVALTKGELAAAKNELILEQRSMSAFPFSQPLKCFFIEDI